MKKIMALLTAVIIVCSLLTFSTSAAVPTELKIYKTETAPNISDSGKIDSVYGEKLFDIKATDFSKDDQNLYPNTQREPHMLKDKGVKEAMAKMRNIGYMTYDNENLYVACEVTDIAPKASANSAEPWKSTNLQLVMFVNEELSFITVAYEGTNKVNVVNDRRSVMDYELVEATFFEKSKTNYVYEIKIPWESFPEVTKADDVWYFRMGIVQSSMAKGYVCTAFGEAYFLQAPKCVPVKLEGAKNSGSATTSSEVTSSKEEDKGNTSSNVTSTNKPTNNNTSSADKNTTTSSSVANTSSNNTTVSTDKNTSANTGATSSNVQSESNKDNQAVDSASELTSTSTITSETKSEANNTTDSNKEEKPVENKVETNSTTQTSSADKTEQTSDAASANQSANNNANAPEQGTDIVGSTEETTGNTVGATESATEETTTVVTEQAEKNWTPIIIIAIIAVVIIAGGAVAIVLLNKKS